MSFYDRHIMPHLINWGCGQQAMTDMRARIVPRARGKVLEIGVGSGLNFIHYDAKNVESVTGIDPSQELLTIAEPRAAASPFSVKLLAESAEKISLEAQSFDSVVVTLTLCSIPNVDAALAEMHRLLKPDGKLYFGEHGHSPDVNVSRWQDRLNPLWGKLMGGCILNRRIDESIRRAGFRIDEIDTGYMPGIPLKVASYLYAGVAVPK